jgi:hypothetical protein
MSTGARKKEARRVPGEMEEVQSIHEYYQS